MLISFCDVYELTFRENSFPSAKLFQEHYLTGMVGSAAFGAIFLFSLRPVRTHAFEFFLILHICLVGVFLTCTYLHQPKYVIFFLGVRQAADCLA